MRINDLYVRYVTFSLSVMKYRVCENFSSSFSIRRYIEIKNNNNNNNAELENSNSWSQLLIKLNLGMYNLVDQFFFLSR